MVMNDDDNLIHVFVKKKKKKKKSKVWQYSLLYWAITVS